MNHDHDHTRDHRQLFELADRLGPVSLRVTLHDDRLCLEGDGLRIEVSTLDNNLARRDLAARIVERMFAVLSPPPAPPHNVFTDITPRLTLADLDLDGPHNAIKRFETMMDTVRTLAHEYGLTTTFAPAYSTLEEEERARAHAAPGKA